MIIQIQQKQQQKKQHTYTNPENVKNEYNKNSSDEEKNENKKPKEENPKQEQAETQKNFGDTLKDIVNGLFSGEKVKNSGENEFLQPKDGEDITMPIEISYKEALNGTNRKINVLHTEVCPICQGKKFANGSKCKYCKGTGEISLHKKLNVKIPPHTENNKKIRRCNRTALILTLLVCFIKKRYTINTNIEVRSRSKSIT